MKIEFLIQLDARNYKISFETEMRLIPFPDYQILNWKMEFSITFMDYVCSFYYRATIF